MLNILSKAANKIRRPPVLLLILLVLICALVSVWHASQPKVPSYHGKSLDIWLKEHDNSREAKKAIFYMGTNAIPFLLDLLTSKENKIQRLLLEKVEPKIPFDLPAEPVEEKRKRAVVGIMNLGFDAQYAIPGLTNCLFHSDPGVRYQAANLLANLGHIWRVHARNGIGDPPLHSLSNAVPALVQCLKIANDMVSGTVISALSTIRMRPDLSVPGLVQFIQKSLDPKNRSRFSTTPDAIRAIGEFQKDAKEAHSLLKQLTRHEDAKVRSAANDTLNKITQRDPEAN